MTWVFTKFAAMIDHDFDSQMMARALQLAQRGYGFTSPNPMVGAVVTDSSGHIIGEGWHRVWGGPHAEVNAIASVRDKSLLQSSTIYVTLEPCSHYGKTPPCAKLLVDSGVKRVVIGCPDPFEQVRGRGTAMLRQAGIEVTEGVMRAECEGLNRKFIYAHTRKRPYVMLKWAQSADGFIAGEGGAPAALSNPVSKVFMHRERAGFDAIMVGTGTLLTDNPALTCRLWPSRQLRPVVYDPKGHVPSDSRVLQHPDAIVIRDAMPLAALLHLLYAEHGVTSLMVEGGSRLLNSFLKEKLWQRIRVEVSPIRLGSGVKAPSWPFAASCKPTVCGGNRIYLHSSAESSPNQG